MPFSFLKNSQLSRLVQSPPSLGADLPFQYQLVRSARRRSVSIEIARAQVIVRAPFFVAQADLEKFVYEKSEWVLQKLTQQTQQLSVQPEYTFNDGSEIPFLGDELTLVIRKHAQADVVRYGDKLLVILSSRSRLAATAQAKRLVCGWYQAEAQKMLLAKTNAAAAKLGVEHAGVTLKATRSKWGHCTVQGAIQYNWQILLAPESVVDYLVAHEVSHLLHHNHSAAFWAVVASICPDYKKRRAWLKANGMRLMF